MSKESTKFPGGFDVYGGVAKRVARLSASGAKVSLVKSGFLSFSALATDMLLGPDRKNIAVFMAYNPQTRQLALHPVPYRSKPDTYAITRTGKDKMNALVSFAAQAQRWGLILDGRSFELKWDAQTKMFILDLSHVVGHSIERRTKG